MRCEETWCYAKGFVGGKNNFECQALEKPSKNANILVILIKNESSIGLEQKPKSIVLQLPN